MSRNLGYFPPNGTKYFWHSKSLTSSPWVCNMWDHWPARIVATVDLSDDGVYTWHVRVNGWKHEKLNIEGEARSALAACLAAEIVCDKQKNDLWKPWMQDAIDAGWRPPCS